MEKPIKIRGHHLICLPRHYNGSYDKKSSEHWKKICLNIRKNPNQKIKVITKCDELCKKCPHFKNNICKKTPQMNKILTKFDEKIIKILGIKNNSIHKAKDIFNLSIDKIKDKDIGRLCNGCGNENVCGKVGINKSFQKELK